MNQAQRKRLAQAREIIEEVADEEREKRDNAPENLYYSEAYEKMEEQADQLDEIVELLEELAE